MAPKESLVEVFPTVRVAVLLVYLVQKSVHHCYVATFVIASQQIDTLRIFYLQAKQQSYVLHGVVSSIDEITDHDEFVIG